MRGSAPYMPSSYRALTLVMLLLFVPALCTSENRKVPASVTHPLYRIALTFDDGPHPVFTEKTIAALEREQVPATFFVVGAQVEKYPDLALKLARAGHEVAVHTYTHRNLCRLPDAEIKKELISTQQLIERITGKKPVLYRPPGGQHDPRVERAAEKFGMSMVLWTVFTNDHIVNDPAVISESVLRQAADGGIILFHSGRPATLSALPGIIQELKSRGYRFVTVTQLTAKR